MSKNILRIMVICVVGAFLCSTAQAGWNQWDNDSGDGQWTTATNWSANRAPASYDSPIIGSLATAGPCTATNGTYTFQYMRVGVENSYPVGTLNVAGANLTCTAGANTRNGFGYGSGHIGILNLSSGSLTMNNGYSTIIGDYYGHGTVNQTGGTNRFTGGGTINVNLGTGSGTGVYNFYAGTLECRSGLNLGSTGTGLFHVYGYDASSSIQIGGTADDNSGAWSQGSGDTLALSIDGTHGTTLINISLGSDTNNYGKATFADGSLLDLDFNGRAKSGTWTVLTAEGGIVDSGLELAAGVNDDPNSQWSFVVDGNDLKVTAVVPVFGTVISIR